MDPNDRKMLERAVLKCISMTVDLGAADPEAERTLRMARAFLLSAYDEILTLQRSSDRPRPETV